MIRTFCRHRTSACSSPGCNTPKGSTRVGVDTHRVRATMGIRIISQIIPLLTDPRSLDDFFSSDLLQEAIGRDWRRNNPYFLPTFVYRSLMALHPIDPLIDALLAGSFAERNPKEKRLLLATRQAVSQLQWLPARIGLPRQ